MISDPLTLFYWKYEYYILLGCTAYSVVIGFFYAYSEYYLCSDADQWIRSSTLLGGFNLVVSLTALIVGPLVAVNIWGVGKGLGSFTAMLAFWFIILRPWVLRKPTAVYLNLPIGSCGLYLLASHYIHFLMFY